MDESISRNAYVENINNFIRHQPRIIGWKYPDLTTGGSSKTVAKLLGFNLPENYIGLTDYEVMCPVAKLADKFRAQDRKAIKNGSSFSIEILKYSDGQTHFLFDHKHIIHDPKGEMLGVMYNASPISKNILKMLDFLSVSPKYLNTNSELYDIYDVESFGQACDVKSTEDISLSKREGECLFYLIRGKTAKEMGRILNISNRTVEQYIQKLKIKFNCATKSQLIECAHAKGYLYKIPDSLLKSQVLF